LSATPTLGFLEKSAPVVSQTLRSMSAAAKLWKKALLLSLLATTIRAGKTFRTGSLVMLAR
jgi:hypothetical protein